MQIVGKSQDCKVAYINYYKWEIAIKSNKNITLIFAYFFVNLSVNTYNSESFR